MQEDQQGSTESEHNAEHPTNPWLYALEIGFFAGLIWGCLRWLFYGLKFTKELPGFLLEPFFQHHYLMTVWGSMWGLVSYIVFSIAAAMLYYIALGKLRGPWPGIGYGIVWWIILFLFVGPWLGLTQRVTIAGWNTLYTELCVFALWGLFIGYTIAFEFTDEESREPIQLNWNALK